MASESDLKGQMIISFDIDSTKNNNWFIKLLSKSAGVICIEW